MSIHPTSRPLVFFIHGLNTFGDDRLHTGPLVHGPMSRQWKTALEKFSFDFVSLTEMGFGSFDEQVERALEQINQTLESQVGPRMIHLLGHSMGGLVARGLAKKFVTSADSAASSRLRSVITLGTPHGGSRAQGQAINLRKNSPLLYHALKLVGYDTDKRAEPLQHFQNEKIFDYDSRHSSGDLLKNGIDGVSLVGAAPYNQLAVPLQFIYRHLHSHLNPRRDRGAEDLPHERSDGLVPAESQRWARVIGEFELDHYAQLGVFLQLTRGRREHARAEFKRAVITVQDIITMNSRS